MPVVEAGRAQKVLPIASGTESFATYWAEIRSVYVRTPYAHIIFYAGLVCLGI